MSERKYLPTIGDLIDRLTINQIKEVLIPEHKEQYAKEIEDILHDVNLILKEKEIDVNINVLRAIVVLSQMNLHIWHNETKCRAAGVNENCDLRLSHGLNGIRVHAKNIINEILNGGGIDHKVDCLAADFKDWKVSW